GDVGGGRRVVDEDGILAYAGKGALWAKGYLAQMVVFANAEDHKAGILAALAGRRRGFSTKFLDQSFAFGALAVIYGDLVSTFFADMPRHGVAHHAETDPRYVGHCCAS